MTDCGDQQAMVAAMPNDHRADQALHTRRYVHGSNAEADDPLIWYEGATQTSTLRRYLHADPRGSSPPLSAQSGPWVPSFVLFAFSKMTVLIREYGNGAVEKTRTSTGFRPQRPQRCASTSSATTALGYVGAAKLLAPR